MKHLFAGLVLLALLSGGSLLAGRAVNDRAEALLAPLQQVLAAAQEGDGRAAGEALGRAEARWQADEGLMAALLSHGYTTRISDTLAELRLCRDEALVRSCSELIRLLRQLQEMDRPRWRNIF